MAYSPKLLSPETSVLLIVDYQQHVLSGVGSGDQELIAFQGKALARAGRLFGAPTVLSTVGQKLKGYPPLLPGIQEEFPDSQAIDRNTMNAWEDPAFRKAVEKTGRRRLIFAALTTDVCLQMPVLDTQGDGYETYFVADAVGAATLEGHEAAKQRIIQAGSKPITVGSLMTEWIRDWGSTPFEQASGEFFEWYMKGIGPIRERLKKEPFQPVLA